MKTKSHTWRNIKIFFILIIIALICIGYKYPEKSKNYVYTLYNKVVNYDKVIIPFYRDSTNNMIYLKIKINDIPFKFLLDTGCSTMLISKSDANFILNHQFIKQEIESDSVYATLANGMQESHNKIILNEISIGEMKIKDVECLISNNDNSPTLIGQSILGKFSKMTIDYKKQIIILEK